MKKICVNHFYGLSNFNKEYGLTAKILEFKIINCNKEICIVLNISTSDFVYYIHRVIYVDSDVSIIEKTYMPLNIVKGLKIRDGEGLVYYSLKKKHNLKIQSSHLTIRASKSNELDRRYLGLEKMSQ